MLAFKKSILTPIQGWRIVIIETTLLRSGSRAGMSLKVLQKKLLFGREIGKSKSKHLEARYCGRYNHSDSSNSERKWKSKRKKNYPRCT